MTHPIPPNQRAALFSGERLASPLAAIFGGLAAAGQPGGWGNFGVGATQGIHNFQQDQQQQQLMQLRQQQMQMQEEEMRRAESERAQAEARKAKIAEMLGGSNQPAPVQPVGNYGAATGGAPQQGQSAILGGMSPQQSALFSQYAQVDPEQAFQMLVERGFATPDAPKTVGGMQWNQATGGFESIPGYTEQAKAIAEAGRNPAAQSDGVWEQYVDPKSGRMGQRNTKTGKIDWDPGNSMMAQVGVDAEGNPVFDFVSGAPGPTKEFESKLANQSLLMGQGLDGMEKLLADPNKPDAMRMAIAGTMANQGGEVGDVLGQSLVLSPEDKQYIAKRSAAMESLANTITGAAFTEEQKKNFISMLPRPTDDDATVKSKMSDMRAYLKEIELNAKVSTRRDEAPKRIKVDGEGNVIP